MPTRKKAKDGLVNPQNELKRLKTKHITISPEIAAACGVRADHGNAECILAFGRHHVAVLDVGPVTGHASCRP